MIYPCAVLSFLLLFYGPSLIHCMRVGIVWLGSKGICIISPNMYLLHPILPCSDSDAPWSSISLLNNIFFLSRCETLIRKPGACLDGKFGIIFATMRLSTFIIFLHTNVQAIQGQKKIQRSITCPRSMRNPLSN